MKNLKIFTMNEDSFNDNNRYSGTYLHGKAEDDYGFDIFSFQRKQNFDFGVHALEINGRDMSFYLWKGEDRHPMYRGYLIYSNDEVANAFCLKNYINREQDI